MREKFHNKILNWAIFIALIANIVVFSSFSAVLLSSIFNRNTETGEILRVAMTSNPVTMDPVDAWDSVSNDMLNQVLETLLAYDLTDPNLPLVGRLAESWLWLDNTTIEFKLRENVFFHDGSRFTADCVLYTITRINYFGNWSGTLDPETQVMAFPHSLYKFRDGNPIFNDTLSYATDDYNVTLKLNRPYGPVEGLLAYTASSIVHPNSTPADEMLDRAEDLVIGTGPFKLVRYIPTSEIRFARWERYWRTGAFWDQIIYVLYRDYDYNSRGVNANNAMLNGKVDWLGQGLASFMPDFEADSDITVTGNGTNDYINGQVYWYIGFNTEWINQTWRKAICHAFNYTYLVKEILEDTFIKANSLVPPGFPGHNASIVGGTYNIPYARLIMQSMGYGYTDGIPWDVGIQDGENFYPGTNETLWKYASFIPLGGNFSDHHWDFGYKQYNHHIELLIQRFSEDMDLIGIDITPQILSWDPFHRKFNTRHIWFAGWGPDYFEAFVMINPLINPESASNYGKINNTELNILLDQATAEINTLQRCQYYKKLQYLIHDKYYYHMPLYYNKLSFVHAGTLKGFPYNSMSSLYWYPTYRDY
ncbi:MAG: ABC transporter substrate-binding protein [Promethearchaeota archaeon]